MDEDNVAKLSIEIAEPRRAKDLTEIEEPMWVEERRLNDADVIMEAVSLDPFPFTENDDPSLAKARREKLDDKWEKSKTDRLEPNLLKLLSEIELPKLEKSRMEIFEFPPEFELPPPARTITRLLLVLAVPPPATDKLDPHRPRLLKDNDDPREAKCRIEILDPSREKLRSDRADPKFAFDDRESLTPVPETMLFRPLPADVPPTDRPEFNLMKFLVDKLEPRWRKSKIDIALPHLAKLRIEIDEAIFVPLRIEVLLEDILQTSNAEIPETEIDDPSLTAALRDIELPKFPQFPSETLPPNLIFDRTDSDDPIARKSIIETGEGLLFDDVPLPPIRSWLAREMPLPTRVTALSESEEPQVRNCRMDKLLPIREKLLILRADPKWLCERTEILALKFVKPDPPKTENPDPTLTALRRDIDEPQVAKLKTESALPNLAKLLIETLEPQCR
jgi:hypothetical protein